MTDRYAHTNAGLDSPAIHAFAITPSDVAALPETTRAIYVGATGAVCVTMQTGSVVTLANVAAGTILPLRATEVRATGTTAASLIGLA